MIAVSISPPAIAIAHPTRPWQRTIEVKVRGLSGAGVIRIQPALGSGSQLISTQLPAWLHVPSTIHLKNGSAVIPIRGQAPRHTALDLALRITPSLPASQGVGVIGAPAVSLLIGRTGTQKAVIHIQSPPLRLTRGTQWVLVTEHNTGTAWIAPAVSIAGHQLSSSMPLMPGQNTTWHLPIPIDGWGSNPIVATAPIAHPVTAHTWVAPAVPAAGAVAGMGILYAAFALGERRHLKKGVISREI